MSMAEGPTGFVVRPVGVAGAEPDEVIVETRDYRFRFGLLESGSAVSMVYKPLNHELRAEDYYRNRNNMFRDWVRLAEPDPATGLTRPFGEAEIYGQSSLRAEFRVLEQTPERLVVQFETRGPAAGGPAWSDRILNRRRLLLRNDTAAIRVENEIVNTDASAHPVVFDLCNGVGLGRVATWASMPGPEGKIGGLDFAEEMYSRSLYNPEPAGDWIGGVNERGLGAGFSLDWADVDAMEAILWKTVGASYVVSMRRRTIPAGGSVAFRYTFMPFTGFGSFDGMRDDLAGGVLVGEKANYMEDVSAAELRAGATLPVRIFLASGHDRTATLRLRCARREDGRVVLDEARAVSLKSGQTAVVESRLTIPEDGLYVLTVAADDGAGTRLNMEKGFEVGATRLVYEAAPPAGEKRGERDAGETMGPAPMDPQFRTLDPSFVTPHLPLLRNHAAGAVRAFFLTPADSTLGHVREICQRSDIEREYFAAGKMMAPPDSLHPRDLAGFGRRLAASRADALVSLGIDWSAGLKRRLIAQALARVKEGMGAVIAVRELAKQPELGRALAEAREVQGPAASVAVQGPAVRRFELGRGRVALIVCDWATRIDGGEAALGDWARLRCGGEAVIVPEIRWRGFEYGYAALGDEIRWAAKRESPITISGVRLDGDLVGVDVHNAGPAVEAALRVVARTRRWEARASGEAALRLPPGTSAGRARLGVAPEGGPLAIEAHLLDGEGRVLAFASAGARAPEPVRLTVTPRPEYQSAAKPGTCAVEIEGSGRGRLEVTVTDRFGRLVLSRREEVELRNGKGRLEFGLDGFRPLSVYHEIVADYYAADAPGRLAAQASADVYLLPEEPPYAHAFVPGVAFHPQRRALYIQGAIEATRRAGILLHTHGPGSQDDRLLYGSGGWKTDVVHLSARSRYAREGEDRRLDAENLIMHPPLLPDEERVREMKARWQARARRQFETGTRAIALDDERRISGDFDFHPHTLAGFREWLKGRYATIGDLNRTWGTAFADFADVVPKRREELGGDGEDLNGVANIAPWLEFRMFIGEVLGRYYTQAPAEWAAEISPDLSAGEWGIYEVSVAWPVDWSRYARCYRHTSRYGDNQGVLEELFRSFAPGTNHGQWIGYGMRKVDPGRRIDPWRSLLNGGRFCWFWAMLDNGFWNYAVCTSDQRPTEGYKALAAEEFPDLAGGIDRLIIASNFTDDRIAVAYSYPSWVADEDALGQTGKAIVEELGYQHTFVNVEDFPSGRLEAEGYRLLILQQTGCLSAEQASAVRRFAEAGGVVLCIGRTGWRDLHGAAHPGGALTDALTGVDTSRLSPLGRVTTARMADGGPLHVAVQSTGAAWAPGARPEVLASARVDGLETPVLTCRGLGKGKVFWLNSTLAGHREVRRGGFAGEETATFGGPREIRRSHWALFERVIEAAGIRPRCRVYTEGRPVFGTETWYYRTPSGRLLFVARYLMDAPEGPLEVRFDRKGHVYEMRSGEHFGPTDTACGAFPPGRMKVYAILDYRVTGLAARTDRPAARAGEVVRVSCVVQTEGDEPDLHALRVSVSGPEGADVPAHRAVLLAPGGRAAIEIPLALNQPPGRHTVSVVDAVSGASATAEFDVQG